MCFASYISHLSVKTFTIPFPANKKHCDKSAMKNKTNLIPISKLSVFTFNWVLKSCGFLKLLCFFSASLSLHISSYQPVKLYIFANIYIKLLKVSLMQAT